MYSSELASTGTGTFNFFSARPVELNIPPEQPRWQSCLFHSTHRSLWAQLNSLCGNRVEGSCKLAGEAKTPKRKEKQSAPQPGGRDLLQRLQSRLAWQTPLRPLSACSFNWQSRKGDWEKEGFAGWHSAQPCQIGLASPCDLLHQKRLVMALQGYRAYMSRTLLGLSLTHTNVTSSPMARSKARSDALWGKQATAHLPRVFWNIPPGTNSGSVFPPRHHNLEPHWRFKQKPAQSKDILLRVGEIKDVEHNLEQFPHIRLVLGYNKSFNGRYTNMKVCQNRFDYRMPAWTTKFQSSKYMTEIREINSAFVPAHTVLKKLVLTNMPGQISFWHA